MAQTLLQLVNRLRNRLRADVTNQAAFEAGSDSLDATLTDLINDAGDYVLGQYEWSFEVRHDGALVTMPDATLTSQDFNSGTISSSGSTLRTAMLGGETSRVGNVPVIRVVCTDVSALTDTALTVRRFYTSTGFGTTSVAEFIEPFETELVASTTDVLICANEYLLPDTVRRVLSVQHQERSLTLMEMSREQGFDRWMQQPHNTFSDSPELVVIGGLRKASHDAGQFATAVPDWDESEVTTGQSLLLYPTPDSRLYLNYSYVYAYPRLSVYSDKWDGVDQMVETAIVDLAYAMAMQTDVGKDPEAGIVLERRAQQNIRALHEMDQKMPGYRRELRSNFAGSYARHDQGRLPKYFGSL